MGVLTHVDDVEAVCLASRGEQLKKHCAKAGLNISWEGPLSLDGGSCKFLKRKMFSVEGGIQIEQDKVLGMPRERTPLAQPALMWSTSKMRNFVWGNNMISIVPALECFFT